MVKPQFEVGKDRVGKGGVVRDPALRAEAVATVADAAAAPRLGARGRDAEPAAGPVRATSSSSCGCGRPGDAGEDDRDAVVRAGVAVRAAVGGG